MNDLLHLLLIAHKLKKLSWSSILQNASISEDTQLQSKGWGPLVFLLSLCFIVQVFTFCWRGNSSSFWPWPLSNIYWIRKTTILRVINIPMHAFIIHRTVLHFGKSVPDLLRWISHNKVTSDLAECPADVSCFSWDGSDEIKRKRKKLTQRAGYFTSSVQIQ